MRLYCAQQDVLSYDTNELSSGIVALDNSFVLVKEEAPWLLAIALKRYVSHRRETKSGLKLNHTDH